MTDFLASGVEAYEGFSAGDFRELLEGELTAYYQALGTREERLFYFEGSDPFALGPPAEAIAALYWTLKGARRQLTEAIFDLLASRIELIDREILRQLIFAIGSMQRGELLEPMISTLAHRREEAADLRRLFVAATSVVKGFRRDSVTVAAARQLVGLPAYPADLVCDMLDVLVGARDQSWSDTVIEMEGKLRRGYRPSSYRAVASRLSFTARGMAAALSIREVAEGLNILVAPRIDAVIAHRVDPMRDPVGILIGKLVLDDGAPFELKVGDYGSVQLTATATGERKIVREPEALHRLAMCPETSELPW